MTFAERAWTRGLRPARLTLRQMADVARRLAFASPLYRYTLIGRTPGGLVLSPPDPWPGDAARGNLILAGEFVLAGRTVNLPVDPWGWSPATTDPAWLAELHGFDWLRDLHVVGSDAGRRRGRDLIAAWIERHGRWKPVSWRPDVLGTRIVAWLGQYDFFCASADDGFQERFLASLSRQARHLARALPGSTTGSDLLLAMKGLIYAGVCLPGGEARLAQGLRLLERELPRQVLADGGHAERSPSGHLRVLRHLIDIRATLLAAGREVPPALQSAIDRMAPMLRFFRHGDGGLALFNDSNEEEAWLVDLVLTRSDAKGKPLASAPHSGFQRLTANRTLLVADMGPPPAPGYDRHAHAGTLAFELSVGKDRVIVNCGAHAGGSPEWRLAQRATAAHSTVTVEDTNSTELRPDGAPGRRPRAVHCRRDEADGNVWVEASHDGYRRALGVLHRRRLFLAATGEDLRGEDRVSGPDGRRFAVRFHLHPAVRVSMVQAGRAALLRLPSGGGWRLRAAGGEMRLGESVYLGVRGEVKRGEQIEVSGRIDGREAIVKWALQRVGDKA